MATKQFVARVHEVSNVIAKQITREEREGGRLSQLISDLVRPGDLLVGDDGFERAARLSDELDSELKLLLSGRDGLKMFAALRHVSPRLWVLTPRSHNAIRRTAELAVHRYATWPERVCLPYHLPRWTGPSLTRVASVLAVAQAFSNTLSARRRIAKGQLIRVASIAPFQFDFDQGTALNRLIDLRDDRISQDGNLLATLGGLLTPANDPLVMPRDWRIVAAEWVAPNEFFPGLEGQLPLERMGDGSWISLLDRIVRQGFLSDVDALRGQLYDFDQGLRNQLGFGVADMDAVLESLTNGLLKEYSVPPRTLDFHGFFIAPLPDDSKLLSMLDPERPTDAPIPLTLKSMQNALEFLDAGHADVKLEHPMQQRPLRRLGNAILYDAVNVRTTPLLWDAPLSEEVRSRMSHGFEAKVHSYLANFGSQPWCSGKLLKLGGVIMTDVDASVIVGQTFIVVDCYGSAWRPALDAGSHSETRNRAERLVRKLREWHRKWSELATYHDFLPMGVSRVLPVVVTATPEWLHLLDPDLWLTERIPRICTVGELSGFIGSGMPTGKVTFIEP